MWLLMMITFIISFFMMLICLLISKKTFMDREKNSPFECGFDPFSSARLPFSIQFFIITIIFVIFDVEIAILIPFLSFIKLNSIMQINLLIIFFIILMLGVYYEWMNGALNWSI